MPELAERHVLRTMNPQKGDFPIKWSNDDPESVETARQAFDDLTSRGFKAYRVTRSPRREGEPITEFDPEAEELLVVPPMRGG